MGMRQPCNRRRGEGWKETYESDGGGVPVARGGNRCQWTEWCDG